MQRHAHRRPFVSPQEVDRTFQLLRPEIVQEDNVTRKEIERLLRSCECSPLDIDQCAMWAGGLKCGRRFVKGNHHGHANWRGVNWGAHRLMYHLFIGHVNKGDIILHKCPIDCNGRCVNPWHLKKGTTKENGEDMKNAGNTTKKFSTETAEVIRKRYREDRDCSQKKLAKEYHVTQSTISSVVNCKKFYKKDETLTQNPIIESG